MGGASKHGAPAAATDVLPAPPPPPPPLTLFVLQVGILVNNAGMSYDHPEYLADTDDQALHDMVCINALVPVMVSTASRCAPGACTAGCTPGKAQC